MNYYDHVGNDYIGSDNHRLTCIQRVRKENGKAIGIIDYVTDPQGFRIERLITIDSVDKEDFKKCAKVLLENSIPVTFHKTPMP